MKAVIISPQIFLVICMVANAFSKALLLCFCNTQDYTIHMVFLEACVWDSRAMIVPMQAQYHLFGSFCQPYNYNAKTRFNLLTQFFNYRTIALTRLRLTINAEKLLLRLIQSEKIEQSHIEFVR